MIRQNHYGGCYSPGLTSTELRSLADLLDHENLPTDPYTIMALEAHGFLVNLETGYVYSEMSPDVAFGHVSELQQSDIGHTPPFLTLIDVLKMPATQLILCGHSLWWNAREDCYTAIAVNSLETQNFTTCAAALNALLKNAQEAT